VYGKATRPSVRAVLEKLASEVNTTKFAKISAIKNNGEIEKNEQE
jgi:hypothetical protein